MVKKYHGTSVMTTRAASKDAETSVVAYSFQYLCCPYANPPYCSHPPTTDVKRGQERSSVQRGCSGCYLLYP